jgi:hypothetical protein
MASGSGRAVYRRSLHAHCATNFYLLSITRLPMPFEIKSNSMEKTVTSKPEVIEWLKHSLDAFKYAHAGIRSSDLPRKVKVGDRDATVASMYLRIIVHANEHMGQLVAIYPDERDCAALGPSSRKIGAANE